MATKLDRDSGLGSTHVPMDPTKLEMSLTGWEHVKIQASHILPFVIFCSCIGITKTPDIHLERKCTCLFLLQHTQIIFYMSAIFHRSCLSASTCAKSHGLYSWGNACNIAYRGHELRVNRFQTLRELLFPKEILKLTEKKEVLLSEIYLKSSHLKYLLQIQSKGH